MRYGTDDRAGGQTSDPVILSRTTSLQGLPREPLDVSVGKMQPGLPFSLSWGKAIDGGGGLSVGLICICILLQSVDLN